MKVIRFKISDVGVRMYGGKERDVRRYREDIERR